MLQPCGVADGFFLELLPRRPGDSPTLSPLPSRALSFLVETRSPDSKDKVARICDPPGGRSLALRHLTFSMLLLGLRSPFNGPRNLRIKSSRDIALSSSRSGSRREAGSGGGATRGQGTQSMDPPGHPHLSRGVLEQRVALRRTLAQPLPAPLDPVQLPHSLRSTRWIGVSPATRPTLRVHRRSVRQAFGARAETEFPSGPSPSC